MRFLQEYFATLHQVIYFVSLSKHSLCPDCMRSSFKDAIFFQINLVYKINLFIFALQI
jgi:hypothetical protein